MIWRACRSLLLGMSMAAGAWAEDGARITLPEPIVHMLSAREAIQTGRYTYDVRRMDPRIGEFRVGRSRVQFTPDHILADSVFPDWRGATDPQGRLLSAAERERMPTSMRVLGLEDKVWQHADPSLDASIKSTTGDPVDGGAIYANKRQFRELGLTPSTGSSTGLSLEQQDLGWIRSFETVSEPPLMRVTMHPHKGPARTWWIDPERGWNPVRVRDGDAEGWSEARITLQLADGIWFPAQVEVFRSGILDGTRAAESMRLSQTEFNRPEHPLILTPADIGIEVGMFVDEELPGGKLRFGHWDGSGIISSDEYLEKVDQGILKPGPTVERLMAAAKARAEADPEAAFRGRLRATALSPRSEPASWERYVLRFIQDHRLDSEQQATAWRILQDCQEQANMFLHRRADDFAEVERDLALLQERPETATPADLDRVGGRFLRLLEPVREIFGQQLKPRLDKLPTRAQRATTQPA